MNVENKTIIITGAARGIGAAMARCFYKKGAKLILGDIDSGGVEAIAKSVDGFGIYCDVTKETDIQKLVSLANEKFGPVDIFISNAGIAFGEGAHAASASNQQWQTSWEIHVMAHVYASRAVLPSMIERGEGYLVQIASAAGLLNQIGDAAYSTTKHAAIGFAEALAITHGKQGIKVSVVCPQYVATQMTGYDKNNTDSTKPSILSTEVVAQSVLEGIQKEQFLILTHPEVAQFMNHKAADYERWLGGMRKLRSNIIDAVGSTNLKDMHKLM